MWPFDSYPECPPESANGKTYDYIVVGGGTAGCVLASRLSTDPAISVLLIERGHVNNNIISRMPLLSQNFLWTKIMQVQATIFSDPITAANDRKNRLWAVNGLGGGSRLNAMLWTRGSPGNYEAWSEMGLTEWAWEKVEPWFGRLEGCTGVVMGGKRGKGGPMELTKPAYPYKWLNFMGKAAQNIGIPTVEDCNDADAPTCGYSIFEHAIDKNGERVSAMSAYLSKKVALERRDHLTVCTGAIASRLEISGDDENGRTVTGVHIRPSSGLSTAKDYFVKARREVILTCGAITTPQLLLLSGIGPTGPNSSMSKLGIPLVKELPAVGADFSDHYSMPIMLEMPASETIAILESALWGLWYILLWIFTGRGRVGLGAAPGAVFLHTDAINESSMTVKAEETEEKKKVPNVEIMFIPSNSFQRVIPGRSMFTLYPTVIQPKAKGRLDITSTDPLVNPSITHPMFGHPDDLRTARLAVRLAMRLTDEFQNLYPFPAPFAFAPGVNLADLDAWEATDPAYVPELAPAKKPAQPNKTWQTVTDDEIDEYMRRVGNTALHFSSTCPIGTDERSGAVDQKLVVFGFKNLRIADTSVFPKSVAAHTMAPVLMVAERCADFVKNSWSEEQTK